MTAAEYAALGATVQAAVVAVIGATVNAGVPGLSLVFDRDPVNFDEEQWLGALKSDADLDETGDKRVHAWLVTFAASDDLESSTTRSIEPTFRLRVQVFYAHDFGTDASNSERRIRDEVLKVQWAFAQSPRLGELVNVERHEQLPMRLHLARLGGEVIHRGEAELAVNVTSLLAY